MFGKKIPSSSEHMNLIRMFYEEQLDHYSRFKSEYLDPKIFHQKNKKYPFKGTDVELYPMILRVIELENSSLDIIQ